VEPRLKVYFIDHPGYFDRAGIYQENHISYADNAERYIFFSKCVVHLARYLPWRRRWFTFTTGRWDWFQP
jgi:starch synthase